MEILEIGMIIFVVILMAAFLVFFYFACTTAESEESWKAAKMALVCLVGCGIVGITGSILFG